MSAAGEIHPVPQTPGDAIADRMAWIERGYQELEEYLQKWAEFSVYLEGVKDEHHAE